MALSLCRRYTVITKARFHVHHWYSGKNGTSSSDQPPSADSRLTLAQPPPPRTWNSWLIKLIGGSVLTLVTVGVGLILDSKRMVATVDETISKGNCDIDVDEAAGIYIARDDVVKDIKELFVTGEKGLSNGFGVILGPTGTGKTYSIKKACQNSPGTLYFEIHGVNRFPRALAKAVGMRTEAGITSFVLGKYFPSFPGHYELPTDYVECIEHVIDIVAERGEIYKDKHKRRPTLFIDGADLLAKHDSKAFTKVVDLAKVYGNEGKLRIVFGCSEGNVIPLIKNTSSNSRCEIMEIVDVAEREAVTFLRASGLPSQIACGVVKGVGTRIIFLLRAVALYEKYKLMYNSESDILKEMIEELKYLLTERALDAIVMEMPNSMVVINQLMSEKNKMELDPQVFLQRIAEEKKPEMEQSLRRTIDLLVKHNTFRYTGRGMITWYSKIVEERVKEKFMK